MAERAERKEQRCKGRVEWGEKGGDDDEAEKWALVRKVGGGRRWTMDGAGQVRGARRVEEAEAAGLKLGVAPSDGKFGNVL